MENLLTNAIRHAPERGTVSLKTVRSPHLLTFTVADTGPGVAPEVAERMFEPFVTGRPDGTGLGLAIARELADAHGGRLLLVSPSGEMGGAVFALELPQGGSWQPS